MNDWLAILKEQQKTGRKMAREVAKMLENPAILADQASMLFDALEKQADFVEKLRQLLDKLGYEPDVIKSAETLEELYGDLAASVAEKVKRMKG